ncbi:MAG TPA: E3 binding domain-containing protein [Thermoleophilaceae bacterium]|nr:E3 binding domain-containing protein [Thermoleophilaceae bacterium]
MAESSSKKSQRAHADENEAGREYRRYVLREEEERVGPPDVLLDVPELRVDSIHLELDDLDAHVALKANVLNLVTLSVGVDAHLSSAKLDIRGVEAEVLLKARLDHVVAIVDRLMTTIDRNPELIEGLSKAVSELGEGADRAVDRTGDALKDVGGGAQAAVEDVGKGAGHAVGDVGKGAGQAVGDVGKRAGGVGKRAGGVAKRAGRDVGKRAGGAVGSVGQSAGRAAGNRDQIIRGSAEQAGARQNGGTHTATPATVAKEVAKLVARELGHAASDEARDLSLAAARKVSELRGRREQRRAEKQRVTAGAARLAKELGIDIADIEGTGTDGRITAKDVRAAERT